MSAERYKVWRNPCQWCERPHYMGEVSPADESVGISAADLVALGLPIGNYRVRVPEEHLAINGLARWKRIDIR